MKRYIKPGQSSIPNLAPPSQSIESGAFDVSELLDKGGEILRREISNLLVESSGKKLSSNSAKDLVAYLKLLSDIKLEQEKALSSLTDEELTSLNKTE